MHNQRPCQLDLFHCRLYDGYTLRCKYKGHTNRNTQVRVCSCLLCNSLRYLRAYCLSRRVEAGVI